MAGILDEDTIRARLASLPGWALDDGRALRREWRFADFAQALAFLNRAAAVCEELDHHADFELAWGRVVARSWSHDLNGITQRDLRLAARLEAL